MTKSQAMSTVVLFGGTLWQGLANRHRTVPTNFIGRRECVFEKRPAVRFHSNVGSNVERRSEILGLEKTMEG